jgi:hypothetical protein
MDLGNPQSFKTYRDSDNKSRTRDFIDFFRQSYNDGFDFIFIQELICYSNIKMIYEALQLGEIPYFYTKNMLPKLLQKWQEAKHCCHHTVVLSRYPVKFGDYIENFSLINQGLSKTGRKTFRFVEFKIFLRG